MAGLFGRLERLARGSRSPAADRHDDVVGHDQRASEEEQPAERAHDVVGMHRRDGLDEGVDEEAESSYSRHEEEVPRSTSLQAVELRVPQRGIRWYSEPKLIMATQPSAPECTWPTVQSV
jgi:hypothetical protein